MPRSARHTRDLEIHLQAGGVMDAPSLARHLGVSQPTLSRLIARLGPQLERLGRGRSTRYALRRDVRQRGDEWPLYRVSAEGKPVWWATLRSLHGGFRFIPAGHSPFWLKHADYPEGVFSGLPFFLQDVRPQGFLGRAIARHLHLSQRYPIDPNRWTDDDVLTYFIDEGADLPGDLVFGDAALAQTHLLFERDRDSAIDVNQRKRLYPARVESLNNGDHIGSSAGGEQPKFTALLKERNGSFKSVLVKFSPPMKTPSGVRWSDLLACEALAHVVLREQAQPTPGSRWLDAGDRRFLEVERFDRTPSLGRRGIVSLGTLEAALAQGVSRDWAEAADLLHQQGLLAEAEAARLRWLWCWGDLIGNTDMHAANASFWLRDHGDWELTPVYDMLPMLFRPSAHGEVPTALRLEPKPPRVSVRKEWPSAASAALDFWTRVREASHITRDFRRIAEQSRSQVARLLERYGE